MNRWAREKSEERKSAVRAAEAARLGNAHVMIQNNKRLVKVSGTSHLPPGPGFIGNNDGQIVGIERTQYNRIGRLCQYGPTTRRTGVRELSGIRESAY